MRRGTIAKQIPRIKKSRREKLKASRLIRISFLPSVFTILNLFLGYMAILHVIKGNFVTAVYFTTASVIMDGFDGTIARLTKSESDFGVQMDSLVDAIAFGFVPSMLIYFWGFQSGFQEIGRIVGFGFLSAGVIRLARFNVLKEAHVEPSNIFIGLPIPMGAISIGSIVLIMNKAQPEGKAAIWLFSAYCILISLLMISNIKYHTNKKTLPLRNSLIMLLILAILIGFAIIYPTPVIPILNCLYVLSPLGFFLAKKIRKESHPSEKANESSSVKLQS